MTDAVFLPITTETNCCSEASAVDPTLSIVSETASTEICCESTGVSDPKTASPGVGQHDGSCSHHAPVAAMLTGLEEDPKVGAKLDHQPEITVDSVAVSSSDVTIVNQASDGYETPASAEVPPDDGALIDALRTVIDPELMINIVDLGLVYSINQTDGKVHVEMTLTSPACPAGPQIISQAKMSLEKLAGVSAAEIKLTMSPPWTPDRMTDDARDQLGIF